MSTQGCLDVCIRLRLAYLGSQMHLLSLYFSREANPVSLSTYHLIDHRLFKSAIRSTLCTGPLYHAWGETSWRVVSQDIFDIKCSKRNNQVRFLRYACI